jgi:hypothetical protein
MPTSNTRFVPVKFVESKNALDLPMVAGIANFNSERMNYLGQIKKYLTQKNFKISDW